MAVVEQSTSLPNATHLRVRLVLTANPDFQTHLPYFVFPPNGKLPDAQGIIICGDPEMTESEYRNDVFLL